MSPFRFTFATAFGPATFTVSLDEQDRPRILEPPLANLPDAAFKLSYGADWTNVRRHFRELSTFLPYSLQAYRNVDAPPEALRAAIAQLPPPRANPSSAEFGQTIPGLATIYHPDEAVRRRALAQFAGRRNAAQAREAARLIYDYLVFLTNAETLRVIPEAYLAIGALNSPEARDFLLRELAQDGRHPYTRHILAALRGYATGEVFAEVRRQYRAGHIGEDDLPALLELISTVPGEPATHFVTDILGDHAYLVEKIVKALRRLGLSADQITRIIIAQFRTEEEYGYLDDLLRAANSLRRDTIDLRAMNDRAAHDAFVDVPPVNWPQQLETGWAELVRSTPLPIALAVVGEYLDRPEPRLQRNALLQLKVLTAREDFGGTLPPGVESRLGQLLDARFDKVYVEVLNLLARREINFQQPLQLVEGILRKSLHTRYRTVVLKALRRTGDFAAARKVTHDFYFRTIQTATGSDDHEHIVALLPYLEKYLGDVSRLREALRSRERQT